MERQASATSRCCTFLGTLCSAQRLQTAWTSPGASLRVPCRLYCRFAAMPQPVACPAQEPGRLKPVSLGVLQEPCAASLPQGCPPCRWLCCCRFKCCIILCDSRWVDPDLDSTNGIQMRLAADMLRFDSMLLMVQLNVRKLLEVSGGLALLQCK